MRKWLLALLVAASPLAAQVKVVTWNVESPYAKLTTTGNPRDKDLSAVMKAYESIGGLGVNDNQVRTKLFRAVKKVIADLEWEQRVPHLRQKLLELQEAGAQIFCLQEVKRGGLDLLLEGTGLVGVTPQDVFEMPPWCIDRKGPRWNPDRFHEWAERGITRPHTCAIVWDPERFTGVSYVIQPHYDSNRVFPAAQLTEKDGEQTTYCVASCHLSGYDLTRRCSPNCKGVRELQAVLTGVEQMYLDYPQLNNAILVIGMDGNFPKGEPCFNKLMKQGVGIWQQASNARPTNRNAQVGRRKLDHVWVLKPFYPVQLSAEVFPDHLLIEGSGPALPELRDSTPRYSDHRAVVCTIEE